MAHYVLINSRYYAFRITGISNPWVNEGASNA